VTQHDPNPTELAGEQAERFRDALPPPLGAGDDADPDRHRARRDQAPHAQQRDRHRRLCVGVVSIAIGGLAFVHI
jgi:hypothetical protein